MVARQRSASDAFRYYLESLTDTSITPRFTPVSDAPYARRWGLGVDYPKRVTSAGNKLRWDDDQQTPDTHTVTFDFGDRSIIWEGRSWSLQWSSKETFGIEFYGELEQVPVDRLGLAAEAVEAGMVEISGGEMAVPEGRPAPRTVIEALGGDVDIVAVEHAVNEAGGDVGGGELRAALDDVAQQPLRQRHLPAHEDRAAELADRSEHVVEAHRVVPPGRRQAGRRLVQDGEIGRTVAARQLALADGEREARVRRLADQARVKGEHRFRRVGQLQQYREGRPEVIIGVTGCMAQRMGEDLLGRAGGVDLQLLMSGCPPSTGSRCWTV